MVKVSVVVPVYQVEKYLPRCLDSVLGQTFTDFEVICVNDGSPDACGEILAAYARKDSRIRVVTQENQGLSMARNNGVNVASGEYVLFLDSDDCIHPQLLEITYTLAKTHTADIVCFGFEKTQGSDLAAIPWQGIAFPESARLPCRLPEAPLFSCTKKGAFKFAFNVWSKLHRRDFIQGLSFIPGIYFEDYPYSVVLLTKAPKVVLLKEKLHYYTNNESSISNHAFTPKHIRDYHTGLCFIDEAYKNASKKERLFVLKEIFSNILKQQLNHILRSPKEKQPPLWHAFTRELLDLDRRGCLIWRGHKLRRYWKYRALIRSGKGARW